MFYMHLMRSNDYAKQKRKVREGESDNRKGTLWERAKMRCIYEGDSWNLNDLSGVHTNIRDAFYETCCYRFPAVILNEVKNWSRRQTTYI